MIEQMMSQFMQSGQAQQAMQALSAKGFSPQQIGMVMQHVGPGAAAHFTAQTAGQAQPAVGLFNIFGGHAGREFLMGAVAGFLRGDGVVGGLEDGAMGMLGGHLAEYIAPRLGVDSGTAGSIAACVTPFVVHYVHDHLHAHHGHLFG